MGDGRITVFLADDNVIVREGVRALLALEPDLDVVGTADDYDSLLAGAGAAAPQVLVTDIRMPPRFQSEGIDAAKALRKLHPGTGVVVLSQYDDPDYAIALLGDGAAGYAYLLKDRVGEVVASDAVTLVDDPTNPLAYTATDIDGEGLAARRNVLITGGVLNGFVHNSYAARRAGTRSTGNAVRGGFKGTPGVGCLALQIAPGTRDQAALIAGIDTTWSAIGASLWHLARTPEDRRRLVADPGLMPTAMEEFLRAYAPVTMARLVKDDLHWRGVDLKADDWILLSFAAANRDPGQFERADEVVIDRKVNRHAAFGLGIHRCVGSHLARMELRVALETWLA